MLGYVRLGTQPVYVQDTVKTFMFVCSWHVCSNFSIPIVNRIYNKIWICILIQFAGHELPRSPRLFNNINVKLSITQFQ